MKENVYLDLELIKEAVRDMGYRVLPDQEVLYWVPGMGFICGDMPDSPEHEELTDYVLAVSKMADLIREKLETQDTLLIYECRDNQELFIESDQTIDEDVLKYAQVYEIGEKKIYVMFD